MGSSPQSSPRTQDEIYASHFGANRDIIRPLDISDYQQRQYSSSSTTIGNEKLHPNTNTNSTQQQQQQQHCDPNTAGGGTGENFGSTSSSKSILSRSVSEKVGHNRSHEVMSSVQRAAWARHTTK
jgi:hypothetical protein